MKFTPGPWKVDNFGGQPCIVPASGEYIATIHDTIGKTKTANARLICAAPELVDVLQEMTERYANLERLYFKALNLLDRSETNGTINRAQNLLARIEGKP